MPTFSRLLRAAAIACALLLAACSPKFDWREVRGAGAPYVVMLPAKPASHTREIDLDGIKVSMTMTAAEVDEVTFAVGAAALPDPAQASKALNVMKTALIRNIGGKITREKSEGSATIPTMIEIEASGPPGRGSNGQPRLLFARFAAKGNYVYQVVAVGSEKSISREAVDTFLASFKPD